MEVGRGISKAATTQTELRVLGITTGTAHKITEWFELEVTLKII